MAGIISHGLACNYRDQWQTEIDNNAKGLPLSRSGASGAAKKLASLRRRNATLLGWHRDADTKKIDALEVAMQRICGTIVQVVEKEADRVCESVAAVASSVAAVESDVKALLRGDVVLDDQMSLQEQRVACDLALVIAKARKRKIVAMEKEQKAQAKVVAAAKREQPKKAPVKRVAAAAKRGGKCSEKTVAACALESSPVETYELNNGHSALEPTPVKMYELSNGRRLWEVQFEADAENDKNLSPLIQLANEDSRRKFLNQQFQTMTGAAKDDVKFALYAVGGRREELLSVLPADDRKQYIHDLKQNCM
jgi:hypothetical protein